MRIRITAVLALTLLACGHGLGQGPDDCAGVGSRCCRGSADCSSPTYQCLAPGEFAGCGACYGGDGCQTDGDCAAMGVNWICEVPRCTCDSEKACIGGCVDDSSCGAGWTCAADHRCRPHPCIAAADCPVYFICGSAGTCMRQPCHGEDDCTTGTCVNGGCYETLGSCTSPPS